MWAWPPVCQPLLTNPVTIGPRQIGKPIVSLTKTKCEDFSNGGQVIVLTFSASCGPVRVPKASDRMDVYDRIHVSGRWLDELVLIIF